MSAAVQNAPTQPSLPQSCLPLARTIWQRRRLANPGEDGRRLPKHEGCLISPEVVKSPLGDPPSCLSSNSSTFQPDPEATSRKHPLRGPPLSQDGRALLAGDACVVDQGLFRLAHQDADERYSEAIAHNAPSVSEHISEAIAHNAPGVSEHISEARKPVKPSST